MILSKPNHISSKRFNTHSVYETGNQTGAKILRTIYFTAKLTREADHSLYVRVEALQNNKKTSICVTSKQVVKLKDKILRVTRNYVRNTSENCEILDKTLI